MDQTGPYAGRVDSTALAIIFAVLGGLLILMIASAAWLAAGNLRRRRGDLRGAFRLGAFVFCVQMALWAARAHLKVSLGTFGSFLVALATSVFYGAVMWTVYMGLEPYVRRRWPQTMISWSALLIGRFRDSVVGRDVLIGCAAAIVQMLINGLSEMWMRGEGGWPSRDNIGPLVGARGYLALVFVSIPHAVREALFFFLLIFLLRALLRNQWAAGIGFALVFALFSWGGAHPFVDTSVSFLVLLGFAFVLLRWGLLALSATVFFANLTNVPLARTSAWYFGETVLMLLAAVALAVWAFYLSLGSRKLRSKEDFFA